MFEKMFTQCFFTIGKVSFFMMWGLNPFLFLVYGDGLFAGLQLSCEHDFEGVFSFFAFEVPTFYHPSVVVDNMNHFTMIYLYHLNITK